MEKKAKGFMALTEDQRKLVASEGGKKAHALGRAHKWTSEEARAASLKGQEAKKLKRKLEADQYPMDEVEIS